MCYASNQRHPVLQLLQNLQDCGDELWGRPSHFRPGQDWFYAMRFFSAISLESLVAYFGILSTDKEEIAKGERQLLLSPPSSTLAPSLPKLRGELRRSERIAWRNITRNLAMKKNIQLLSSLSPASRRHGSTTRKGPSAIHRTRKSYLSRRDGTRKVIAGLSSY